MVSIVAFQVMDPGSIPGCRLPFIAPSLMTGDMLRKRKVCKNNSSTTLITGFPLLHPLCNRQK